MLPGGVLATLVAAGGAFAGQAHAGRAMEQEADAARLVARARAAMPARCGDATDTLVRVLCRGELRVGTRTDYPPFSRALEEGGFDGFEPALARLLAARLGVKPRFVGVSAADRMAALGDGRVDVLVATTGHTVQRDAQALFVRPHYYRSHTVVVGRRVPALDDVDTLASLAGRTVCVTVGNATNAELAVHGARLMLFGSARQLVEQVQQGACTLAAHDDSLLLPVLPAGYEVKLRFAPLPWGVVAGRDGGAALARVLGLALQRLHARGGLEQLARQHGVATPWLREQRQRWSAAPCSALAAPDDLRCVDAPYDGQLAPTAMAGAIGRLEDWVEARAGWRLTLAMLKTQVALRLFLEGVGCSLALVAGAVASTVLLALGFGAGLASSRRWLRWPLRALLVVAQSTPMVLLMSVAGLALSRAGLGTPAMTWLAAVAVLGLFNGSNAGQAVAEARASLRVERRPAGLGQAALRARAQIAAFTVNATRGSPAASLIGVPELLAAQTDIASFSSERVTTFTVLLLFYMVLVSLVVAMLKRVQRRLQPAEASR